MTTLAELSQGTPKVLIDTLAVVNQIHSLAASAGLTWHEYSPQAFLAALYQDDDAHDTCSLTACLNPLHPGPCKGWKGDLFDAAPTAWHSLEAAKVEKANAARVKKIAALKQAGKPIPHKLLTPIVAKPHPHAGQTANKATGEAHEAGKAVTESAGIKTATPGKVSLGQAVKPVGPVQLGPKGKKPTVASKGIAHVIAQEKVTPQYKLDKAAKITPEQWAGLSEGDQSVIRGELAKVKKDGFGPQQKKADELLAKLTPGEQPKAAPPKVVEAHEPTPKFVGQKDSHGVVSKAKPGGEVTVATSAGVPNGYQVTKDGMGWSLKHKGKLIRTSSTKEALVEYAQEHHAKNAPAAPKLGDALKKAAPSAQPKSPEPAAPAPADLPKAPPAAPTKLSEIATPDTAVTTGSKPKPLPKHVQDAIAMAKGQAPGATWSKNHLAAYQTLTADEFHALPKDVQDTVVSELTKGQSKFLDPKKITAAKALLEKFGHGEGAPKSAATPKIQTVDFATHLHDHSVTEAQAKKVVENTGIPALFAVAKSAAGLTDLDNPNLGFHALNAADDAKALLDVKTKLYDSSILGQHDVKAAAAALTTAAAFQAHAQSVLAAKTKAYNKISMELAHDHGELSPIEKASLLHLQKHLAAHANPPTSEAAIDKLKAATKQAENVLTDKLHAAVKQANAPKPADMSAVQISDRAQELLGSDAGNPDVFLNLGEMQTAKAAGLKLVVAESEKYPQGVVGVPPVTAKAAALAHAVTQLQATEAQQLNLHKHLNQHHAGALTSGKAVNGAPLTAADRLVIKAHAAQVEEAFAHLGVLHTNQKQKVEAAKAEFHAAAAKTQAALKPAEPHKLTEFDKATVTGAYSNAWAKHASAAVSYGVKSYAGQQKMKAHAQYPSLKMDLNDLKVLAGKVAVAHAEEHTASLNVPTDPDTGANLDGPEKTAWAAAMGHRVDLEQQFAKQHKTAQARLDAIRVDVGLKKRALPKIDSAAVKTAAAETGAYSSGGLGGPNYNKPQAAKHYMLAKAGPKIAVVHKTSGEKKTEKLADAASKTPSSPKIENAPKGEPVKLGADASIAHIPTPLKQTITADFKGMPKGKYLTDPTGDIFDNLVNLAAAHGKGVPDGLSIDQVLKTIDETHSKNLGATNKGMLHGKVTDWLGTTAGKEYAEKHSVPNPKAVKELTGEIDLPKGVTLAPGQKVQKLAGPGAFDPSLKAKDFKAHTSSEAQAEQDAYMEAQGLKWTAVQKKAMKAYTGNGEKAYDGINNYLRGEGHFHQVVKQYAVDIQSAMMPLREDTLLKRGTGWPPAIASFASHPQDLMGKSFEDDGFVSSSVAGSGGHFSGKPLQLVIEAPAGTPAVFVDSISHYGGSENEMLLAAGTKFRVLSVDKTSGGHTLLRVRVVGDK